MVQKQTGRAWILLCGLLAVGVLVPTVGWGQTPDPLQQVEKRLADKQAGAETHRKQMESLKDPNQLTTAMQQHFLMTEEILALMLERRKLTAAQAPTGGAASGSGSGMPGGGMQGQGMMEHGRGMMQKEMGGMQGSSPQGGGMPGSAVPQQGMSGMSGSGMPGHPAPGASSGQTAPSNDIEQMMQRIAEHSAYMETIKDQPILAQEMLRHQKMLDQMLQLMQ